MKTRKPVILWTAGCTCAGLLSTGTTSAADSPPATPPPADNGSAEAVTTDRTAPEEKSSWSQFVESEIGQAFAKGKFNLNARLRWEHADATGSDASNAVTLRPRFGFTTAEAYGFQGMLEAENITSLGADYNPAGLDPNETHRTVIADPETTELNQAWLSYARWDSLAKVGRQRIVLDNHRFIGDVGWRQNMQTYDAVMAQSDVVPNTTLFYGYLYRVNRVLGDRHPAGNWRSSSHLMNASYTFSPWAKLTGYGYLLDFESSPVNSSYTAGTSITGKGTIVDELELDYRAEMAWQTDARDNPNSYDAFYAAVTTDATWKRFTAGMGYELLGSDNGNTAFRTPLATLHKFNGWADVFLTTPNDGLQDFWIQAGVTLPWEIPVKLVYHKFWADNGGRDYGHEIDAVISRKFGKYVTVLAKYAFYDGDTGMPAPDTHRFWLQAEFNY